MWRIASLVVLFLSVCSYQFHDLYLSVTPCTKDPRIVLGGLHTKHHSWDACRVFSLEYSDARDKFRAAAQQLHADLYSLPIVEDAPSDSLTTDIAILQGDRPGMIVHSSATHGVEGYAGSAIQLALLDHDMLPPKEDRPTIVLVHAINPYGMKFYRRFNEHNVDLNRNAIHNFEQFVKERDPNIAKNYDQFREFLGPPRAPTWWDATFGFWFTVIPLILQEGYTGLKRVLVAGQYHHPEGIFFGGTEVQPSIEKLFDFVQSLGILDAEPLVWIDVHTGLGDFGKDTLITETAAPVSTLQSWFPTAESIITPEVSDKKAMSGYELTKGMFMTFLHEGATGMFVTQEFGTLPGVLVARALVLENMMHHYGTNNKELGRQWLQSAFYPQSTEWRVSIVQRGVALMLQAIDYANVQQPQRTHDEIDDSESSE
jgi:hypothetical protein